VWYYPPRSPCNWKNQCETEGHATRRMLILRRLSIWPLETSLEALLLGVVLVSSSDANQHNFVKDVAVSVVWIATMFFSTGYLLTTGIARAIWQPGRLWPYSMVATALFFIHFEILNHSAGGIFDPPKRAVIRIAGGCIAFACTLLGTLVLRQWTTASSKPLEPRS
jgi:hypothetical protein